jgi:hypothetical protein
MVQRAVKIGSASLAFIPTLVLILAFWLHGEGRLPESTTKVICIPCLIFDFPPLAIGWLIKTSNVNPLVWIPSTLAALLLWTSLLAWLFWKVAGTFHGEGEPPYMRGKFDWIQFQVRFVCGFVIGFLVGWRFVRNTTSQKTMLIASIVGGIIGGFALGFRRPPDFWSRG